MNPEKIVELPKSYTSRPTHLEDAKAVAQLWDVVSEDNGLSVQPNPDSFRAEWIEPKFDLESSSRVVVDTDGDVIAYAILWDNSDLPVDPWLIYYVHPQHREKGIETYLLDWLEQTAERVIDRCPPDTQIKYRSMSNSKAKQHIQFLENKGFKHTRSTYHMLIDMQDTPSQPKFPEGISVRSFHYPDELEQVIRVDTEAFRDMWGFVERSIEEDLPQWQHEIESNEHFDASLWFLAIDDETEDIIGLCLCNTQEWAKPDNAYIESVAVLRPYRRRGIAKALLNHAFSELYQRGYQRIALHVDTESLTGAATLYAEVGMKPDETWMKFEKIIREGKSLATTSLKD